MLLQYVVIETLTHKTSWKVIKLNFFKLEAVGLPQSREGRLFSGGKFTEVSVQRADGCGDLFSSQTLGELKFLACDRRRFSGRNVTKSWYDGREDRQEDGRLSTYNCGIFFPHISFQRQLQFLCYFSLVM